MFNVRPAIGFNVSAAAVPGFRVDPRGNPRLFDDEMAEPAPTEGNPDAGYLLWPYGINLPAKSPFSPVSTDDYCREVIRNCNAKCVDRYEALGGELGPVWWRRCVRDCVAPTGCSY